MLKRALQNRKLSYAIKASEVTKLANGVRVASAGDGGELATIGIYLDHGSRNENASNNGITNLSQRTAFASATAAKEISHLGGHVSGNVGRGFTSFQATVDKKHVGKAFEVLSHLVTKVDSNESTFNAQKDAVLRQIAHQDEAVQNHLYDALHSTAFQASSLSLNPLGSAATVKSLSYNDTASYISSNISGSSLVVSGSGGVSQTELSQLAEKYLSGVPQNAKSSKNNEAGKFTGSDLRFREDGHKTAKVLIGFQTTGASDAYQVPLWVMQSILGSWHRTAPAGKHSGSYLLRNAAEYELAHSINAFNIPYKDTGLFGVEVVCEARGQHDLMFYVMEAITSLSHEVTEPQVARAKTDTIHRLLSGVESSTSRSKAMAQSLFHNGRIISRAELLARINAVDVATVKLVAQDLLNDQDPAVTAIGPIHELPDYQWLRRRTFWSRY